MKSKRGFSMTELMVSTAIISVVMTGMYLMIISSQKSHISEGVRADMLQNSRFLQHLVSEKLRSAGAGLSQVNLSNIEHVDKSLFQGIWPLNNVGFPDGLIMASADPNVFTKIAESSSFTPGDTTMSLDLLKWPVQPHLIDNTRPEWQRGDTGIIFCDDGYYVFEVSQDPAIGDTQLDIRQRAVYFSGLLKTDHYEDEYEIMAGLDHASGGSTGDSFSYPAGSPVFKLDYFYILLVDEDAEGKRVLTLTTDTQGLENPLDPANVGGTMGVPISEVVDLQFEYIDKENQYWCSLASIDAFGDSIMSFSDPTGSGYNAMTSQDFHEKFKTGQIIGMVVSLALRTKEEKHRSGDGITYVKPPMGDNPTETITGKYRFSDFQFEVLLRNFHNKSN